VQQGIASDRSVSLSRQVTTSSQQRERRLVAGWLAAAAADVQRQQITTGA